MFNIIIKNKFKTLLLTESQELWNIYKTTIVRIVCKEMNHNQMQKGTEIMAVDRADRPHT